MSRLWMYLLGIKAPYRHVGSVTAGPRRDSHGALQRKTDRRFTGTTVHFGVSKRSFHVTSKRNSRSSLSPILPTLIWRTLPIISLNSYAKNGGSPVSSGPRVAKGAPAEDFTTCWS